VKNIPCRNSLNAFVVLLIMMVSTVWADSPQFVEGQVIVKLRSGVQSEDVISIQQDLGAITVDEFSSIGAELWEITADVAQILRFKSDDRFEYIEPNYIVSIDRTPNDPDFSKLWGLPKINAPKAWDTQTGGNIIVAVIDTGVDYKHPDLITNMWVNTKEIPSNGRDDDGNGYVDDYYGYDFANKDGDPFDDHFHGTHVAGTIAATGNNATGIVGVSWSAKIMAVKFLSKGGSGKTSDAISAIEYASKMGAQLSNNSWGGSGYSSALHDAINVARKKGHLFVAAAGNSGTNNDHKAHYPSNYSLDLDNVIAVAATDSDDGLASFSCYGLKSVHLAAPGVSIYSTTPNNSYKSLRGTSMAAPHVSGAITLLWSTFPKLSSKEVKKIILSSVDKIPALSGKMVTGGRLNVYNAFPTNKPPTAKLTFSPESGSAPLQLKLNGSSSYDPDGSIVNYVWQVSGPESKQVSNAMTTSITLTLPGDYGIRLKITDDKGAVDITEVKKAVTIDDNKPPKPFFTISPASGTAPLTVVLDGKESSDDDGDIVDFHWKSTDGHTKTGQKTSMVFDVEGTHEITLVVTDNGGKTQSLSKSVTVHKNEEPVAFCQAISAKGKVKSVEVDEPVSISASGSFDNDGFITAYSWEYSGRKASGSNVNMVFSEVGTHDVFLTVQDDNKQTGRTKCEIKVDPQSSTQPCFEVSPASQKGFSPLTVRLNGSCSKGTIKKYTWISDKGLEESGLETSIRLDKVGIHKITLKVIDENALENTITKVIRVEDGKPRARFTRTPTSGCTPLDVTLDGSSSSDQNGTIVGYKWNSDKGLDEFGITNKVVLTDVGFHKITLIVTDNDGLEGKTTQSVKVDECDSSKLINLSSLASVGNSVNLTAGFIISKKQTMVMVRGFGIDPGVDTTLVVNKYPTGEVVKTNDNWQTDSRANEIRSDLKLPKVTDAGLLLDLLPGAYTTTLTSKGNAGLGLIGVDDATEANQGGQLANISSLYSIGGNTTISAGFIITGTGIQTVMVRGFGIDVGVDATLTVNKYPTGEVLKTNNDWQTDSRANEIRSDLKLPKTTDAGLLLDLLPGAYTVTLASNGTSGRGLIGVDAVDN
jgi:subtilisin family serine protease